MGVAAPSPCRTRLDTRALGVSPGPFRSQLLDCLEMLGKITVTIPIAWTRPQPSATTTEPWRDGADKQSPI